MRRYTRRQFLDDSILTAAVAAVLPAGHLLAADVRRETQPKKRPGEVLHVAVVGVRGRGGDHITQFLANSKTQITHIVDVDEKVGQKRVEAVGKKQGNAPKFVRDLRKVLDDKSVDIVSIATPNHWHALAAIWAMQAGKDVYVEKPVSHNVSEGRRMVGDGPQVQPHLPDRHAMPLDEGHDRRRAIRQIRQDRRSEAGPRLMLQAAVTSIGPKGNYHVPPEVDYNLWCGPSQTLPLTRRQFHYDWHWQREWGNGDMGNQGPHQMDIARWGLGVDRLADSVIAYGGRLGYEDAGDVANTEVGIFEFGDKTLAFRSPRSADRPAPRGQGRRDLLWQRRLHYADQFHDRSGV